jgi:hypothetical protein
VELVFFVVRIYLFLNKSLKSNKFQVCLQKKHSLKVQCHFVFGNLRPLSLFPQFLRRIGEVFQKELDFLPFLILVGFVDVLVWFMIVLKLLEFAKIRQLE